MNTGFFPTLCTLAVCAYCIPLFLVWIRGLWKDRFFRWLALYWAWGALVNGMDLVPGFPEKLSYVIAVGNNIIDIPLILVIFYCTTSSILIRRFVAVGIMAILLAEAIALLHGGFRFESLKIPVGMGILCVMYVLGWEIVRYTRKVEHTNRQNARALVYAALLFEFATFFLIYIFDYFIGDANQADSFMIFYISTLVTILIATCGYLLVGPRRQSEAWSMQPEPVSFREE